MKAHRLYSPSNIRWRITMEPDSNGVVTVVLPETANCDAQGVICTKAGSSRMLSNRLQFTVRGPGQWTCHRPSLCSQRNGKSPHTWTRGLA